MLGKGFSSHCTDRGGQGIQVFLSSPMNESTSIPKFTNNFAFCNFGFICSFFTRIWDARNLQVCITFPRKLYIQNCCDLSEDNNYAVTCSNGFGGNGCEATVRTLPIQGKQNTRLVLSG